MSTKKFDNWLSKLFRQYEAPVTQPEWDRIDGFLRSERKKKTLNLMQGLLMLLITLASFISGITGERGNTAPGSNGQLSEHSPANERNVNNDKGNNGKDITAGDKSSVVMPGTQVPPVNGTDKKDIQHKNTGDNSNKTSAEQVNNKASAGKNDRDNNTADNSNEASTAQVNNKTSAAQGVNKTAAGKNNGKDTGKKEDNRTAANQGDNAGDASLKNDAGRTGGDKQVTPIAEEQNTTGKRAEDPASMAGNDDKGEKTGSDSTAEASVKNADTTVVAKAQDITKPKPPAGKRSIFSPGTGRFVFGVSLSPGFASEAKKVRSGQSDKVHVDYAGVEEQEKARVGMQAGFSVGYNMFSGLTLTSGVQYQLNGHHNSYDYRVNRIPIIDSETRVIKGYINVNDTEGIQNSSNVAMNMVSVPLGTTWRFGLGSRYSLVVNASVNMSYLVSAGGKAARYDNLQLAQISAGGFNRFSFGGSLAMGLQFPLGGGFSGVVGPYYSRMSDINKSRSALKANPQAFGLNFSLIFDPAALIRK